MVKKRVRIPKSEQTFFLMLNMHACCVCGDDLVVIHHIDGNPSNNKRNNLAVLCQKHHEWATVGLSNVKTLTKKLTPTQVKKYKHEHESSCSDILIKISRERTAFNMVDYKNAERIRQIYAQISHSKIKFAYDFIKPMIVEESKLRDEQKLGEISKYEPNLYAHKETQSMVEQLLYYNPHPPIFGEYEGHPKDPCLPLIDFSVMPTLRWKFDLWNQVMARVIVITNPVVNLETAMKLPNNVLDQLEGRLINVEGITKGIVNRPENYKKYPISQVTFVAKSGRDTWKCNMSLKTHYVYSDTAVTSLSEGKQSGLVMIRSIDKVRKFFGRRWITFSCTPLILGVCKLQIPVIE